MKDWISGRAWRWRNGSSTNTPDQDQAEKEKFDREAQEQRESSQERAEDLWAAGTEAETYPYLDFKRLEPVGLRVYKGLLLAPGINRFGELQTVQKIDHLGIKRFVSGTQAKGAYFPLLREASTVLYLVEGVADALAVYHSTERSDVWASFGTSNLISVAFLARDLSLPVIIVADADEHGRRGGGGKGSGYMPR